MVRALKVIGLGTLFTLLTVLMLIGIAVVQTLRTKPLVSASHATGLTALKYELLFSPFTYIVLLGSFGLAYWLVRK
jgi:hypothetical protein